MKGMLVGLGLILALAWALMGVYLGTNHSLEDHTHTPTGIQDGAEVCVVGEGAVDYDITTTRPFLLCGSINVFEEEEVDPPLGADAHLVQ